MIFSLLVALLDAFVMTFCSLRIERDSIPAMFNMLLHGLNTKAPKDILKPALWIVSVNFRLMCFALWIKKDPYSILD